MLAIWGMHFTAMGAATIVPDTTVVVQPTVINSATLAIGVAGITMLVIVAALAMAVIDAQAERTLPARNQQLVDPALDGLIVAKDGRIVNVNPRMLELSGWSSSELLGKSVAEDLVAGAVERAPTASIKATEAFLKTARGDLIPIEVVCQHLHGSAQGNEVYAIRELTERRAAEQELRRQTNALQQRADELRQQNVRLDLVLTNMAQGLCVFDAAQRLVTCNEPYLRMYHLSAEQAKPGTTPTEILNTALPMGSSRALIPKTTFGNALLPSPTRKLRWPRTASATDARYAFDTSPFRAGAESSHDDITEREKLSAQLEQNNKLLSERTSLLQAVVDNFPGGISLLDSDLRVALLNEKASKVLDLPDRLFANGPPSLEEVFRFNASRGEYGPGDVEEQVAARMALARAAQAPPLRAQTSGRDGARGARSTTR